MSMISDAEIAEIRRKAAEGYEPLGCYNLSPLKSRAEVFGYCIEVARQNKWDEVEVIDALLKVTTPWREDIREVEQVLRPLGYIRVSDYLHKAARHLPSKPPSRWPRLTHPSQADIPDHSWRKA